MAITRGVRQRSGGSEKEASWGSEELKAHGGEGGVRGKGFGGVAGGKGSVRFVYYNIVKL